MPTGMAVLVSSAARKNAAISANGQWDSASGGKGAGLCWLAGVAPYFYTAGQARLALGDLMV
jgi:hypothetical protein